MARTGFKGIDCRQTGNQLVFRASLKDSSGVKVTTGTTTLRLFEYQSDGTLTTYDFNDNTFKTGACTTATLAMTHRTGDNSTYDTGVWSVALATLTGFSVGSVYFMQVSNSGASPVDQERDFQYGSAEGDVTTTAVSTGVANVNTDAKAINGVSTASVTTVGANIGTTEPLNFFGTGGAAYVKSDIESIVGDAAAADGLGQAGAQYETAGGINADVRFVLGTILTEGAAGRLAASLSHFLDVTGPTGTVNSLPNAVPGATSGLFFNGANAAVTITGAFLANHASNNVLLGATQNAAAVAALAASIIKGTYTFADLEKDLAMAVGGVVTGGGTNYAVPGTGWGVANTQAAVAGTGGDRTITRS